PTADAAPPQQRTRGRQRTDGAAAARAKPRAPSQSRISASSRSPSRAPMRARPTAESWTSRSGKGSTRTPSPVTLRCARSRGRYISGLAAEPVDEAADADLDGCVGRVAELGAGAGHVGPGGRDVAGLVGRGVDPR